MTTPHLAPRAPDQTISALRRPLQAVPPTSSSGHPIRALYFALSKPRPDAALLDTARRFLDTAIADVAELPSDLPTTAAGLAAWISHNTQEVGHRYQEYLSARHAGGPRQYFGSKSHALNFLKSVAPTKTVDGAWLYGLLRHWNDGRFGSLIRIYLEELGCGMPDKNHVLLYKKLLAANGCEQWDRLSEPHYVQGTIQLALSHQADRFLPEVIGFNLGYEQLPLHLLIAAYELNELGIDPYYFTLHVTVDNADTGHAKTALNGLQEAWPVIGDGEHFYARVAAGYKLSTLGASTNSVIADFDLEQELIAILAEKSVVGNQVHSDYCKVAGRAINDWLRNPAEMPVFLQALQQTGWIRRHEAPENSRFWKLIQGERADMFGVFSAYEQQVIWDWINGDAAKRNESTVASDGAVIPAARPTPRVLGYKARQKLLESLAQRGAASNDAPISVTQINDGFANGNDNGNGNGGDLRTAAHLQAANAHSDLGPSDFDHDLRQLDQALASTLTRQEAMQLLVHLMSPALHHTPVGLKATRLFAQMFG